MIHMLSTFVRESDVRAVLLASSYVTMLLK